MANGPYDYETGAEAGAERSVGEHVFIWIAWALAAAFWGATMTTFFGIMRAIAAPGPGIAGGADAGGVMWVLADVVGGMLVLGGAMAYASWMFARRNRSLDPVAEARTASLYDAAERNERR